VLRYALRAAEALSELGDPSGLELAARMALTSEYAARRRWSFRILVNLARCDESVLSGQNLDPLSVLTAAAESETDPGLLSSLTAGALSLSKPKAMQLHEKLIASPHLRDSDRKLVRRRIKAMEKQASPPMSEQRRID
jgi:hypothetical protein